MGWQTPHEILDISPDATPEQITRAFRKLAIKYHPDKKTGDSGKFQAIREAYEYLKKNPTVTLTTRSFGRDLKITITVPLQEVAEGRTKTVRYTQKIICRSCKEVLCTRCGGKGRDPVSLVMKPERPCRKCGGTGRVASSEGCLDCGGAGYFEQKASIGVDLHPLIAGPMVFKGRGNDNGTGKGDLIIEVYAEKDKIYIATGLHLKRKLTISPAQAIVGDVVRLSVWGREAVVVIPPGTSDGESIKTPCAGMTYQERIGDLIVGVSIKMPTIVSAEERDLYTEILKIEKESLCRNL